MAEHLIGPNPLDAILAPYDGAVPFVNAACRLLGRAPGEDIWVAGYDNLWHATQGREWEAQPPAVTVDKNYFTAGCELVSLLLDPPRDPGAPAERRLIQPRLVLAAELESSSSAPTG